jgi:hypothetical protein
MGDSPPVRKHSDIASWGGLGPAAGGWVTVSTGEHWSGASHKRRPSTGLRVEPAPIAPCQVNFASGRRGPPASPRARPLPVLFRARLLPHRPIQRAPRTLEPGTEPDPQLSCEDFTLPTEVTRSIYSRKERSKSSRPAGTKLDVDPTGAGMRPETSSSLCSISTQTTTAHGPSRSALAVATMGCVIAGSAVFHDRRLRS